MSLDLQLREADPARYIPDDLGRSTRAQAGLASITSATPDGGLYSVGSRPRRWGRYSLAVAAAATGIMVAPVLGSGSAAYASWTAVPRSATAAEDKTWGGQCLSKWKSEGHDFDVRLVEVRGPWTYTVLAGADGYEATCLVNNDPDSVDGSSGGFSAPLPHSPSRDSLITNSVRDLDAGVPGVHQLEVTGKVGSDVATLAFRAQGTSVKATVSDGYFAAWWPERQGKSLLSRVRNAGPPNPEVTITLVDGTTRTEPIQNFDVSPL